MWQLRSKSELIRFVKRFAPYKKRRDHNSRSRYPLLTKNRVSLIVPSNERNGVSRADAFRADNDPMRDLRSRIALVTGGSRGIGAGIAVALARVGADIAVKYHERADPARTVCGEIRATGRKAIAVQADVSVSAHVERMISQIEAQLGHIDILVNNAAIVHPRKFEEITELEWDEMLREVFTNIEAADNFVFIISPESVASANCRKEIDHAVANNKPLVPIFYRPVADEAISEAPGQISKDRFW